MAKRKRHPDAPDTVFPGRTVPGELTNDELEPHEKAMRERQKELEARRTAPAEDDDNGSR